MRIGSRPSWRTTGRGVGALFALGMVGVIALAVYTAPTLRTTPGLEGLSYPLLLVVAGVNSAVLLTVFTVLGALTAPRLGLRSHVFTWARRENPEWGVFRASLPQALGLGAGLFFVATLLQAAFTPLLAVEPVTVVSDADSLRSLAVSIPMRLFYGGITEEILLRWGVMAPIAWVLWRVGNRSEPRREAPSDRTVWVAIISSAVLFGIGHLPAAAMSSALTIPVAAQIITLNTVVGVGFGWLFWRYSLETAMVAHTMFHVTLVVTSTALRFAT